MPQRIAVEDMDYVTYREYLQDIYGLTWSEATLAARLRDARDRYPHGSAEQEQAVAAAHGAYAAMLVDRTQSHA